MDKRSINLAILIFGLAGIAFPAERQVSSRISSVTVYPDNALVKRTARLTLSSGHHKLVFSNLPSDLRDESVRVEGDGVELGDVTVRTVFLEKAFEEKVLKLESQIEALKDQDKALVDKIGVLKAKEKFLESIQVSSTTSISEGLRQGKVNPEAWRSALNFIFTEMSRGKVDIRSLESKRQELARKIAALEKELQEIQADPSLERKDVLVEVQGRNKEAVLNLSYVVSGAHWRPGYEVRALPDEKKVEIAYYGEVAQRSGEEWENVDLIFSTAKPALGAQVPELLTWNIDLAEPIPRRAAQRDIDMQEAPIRVEMKKVAPMELPPEAEAVETGVSVIFKLTGKKSIPSGEGATDILITREAFPAEFSYLTVPKLSEYAYLSTKVKNETDYPMLSGPVNVFVGSDFVGKSRIENIAPQEEFELSLGIDERIKVRRELIKRLKSGGGFLSRKERVEYKYRITVENYRSTECRVTVLDQLPVSQSAALTVKEMHIEPKPSERDDEEGILKWCFTLKPQEKQEIILGFMVEYPRGKIVRGLF